jgi:ribonuclease-3
MAAKSPTRPNENSPASLDALETLLGHHFADRALLELSLTHRSVAHERAQQEPDSDSAHTDSAAAHTDNEQLEFLGDAVVGLLVADELYRRFPALDEGGLTRLRAFLVSRRHLAEVAIALDLGRYLRLGRGEEQTGGRAKSALLANAIEAVLAAVYIDAGPGNGLETARRIVTQHVIHPALDRLTAAGNTHFSMGDHKSALQQRMQAAGLGTPHYVVTAESGPDHRKHFTVEVHMDSVRTNAVHMDSPDPAPGKAATIVLGQASAGTKKQAQQAAARIAFTQLDSIAPQPPQESAS